MNQLMSKIGKDKFIILAIAGVILLLMESSVWKKVNGSEANAQKETTDMKQETVSPDISQDEYSIDCYEKNTEQKLVSFISQIEGAGKTAVLVSTNGSAQKIVEKDAPYTRENDNSVNGEENTQSTRVEENETTVFVEDVDGNKTPFICKEYAPKIIGVVVACEGGDNEEVVRKITEICQSLFDLDAHTIKVVKIKE